MAAYSIIYILNALGMAFNGRNKRVINGLVIVCLIFISGTRYYMGGSDVFIYEHVYNGAPSVGVVLRYFLTGVNGGVNTNYEIGFLLICSIVKSAGLSYFGFTLVFAILFYVLMYKGLQEFVSDWAPFWAIFMYKIMFYDTFISIRQGLTLAIFCYSLRYIRDRKIVKYFITAFFAFFVHRGAIILFPLYFIQLLPISKILIKWVAIGFLPTWFLRDQTSFVGGLIERIIKIIGFASKSEGWAEATEQISIIHTIECYIFVILVLMFYEKIVSTRHKDEVGLVLRLFIVLIPIFTLLSNWIVMTREKDYFVLMYGILMGYILEGGTTNIIKYDNSYPIFNSGIGRSNAQIISLVFFAACFIGMTRYVVKFDGGALMHFTSYISRGVSIFR